MVLVEADALVGVGGVRFKLAEKTRDVITGGTEGHRAPFPSCIPLTVPFKFKRESLWLKALIISCDRYLTTSCFELSVRFLKDICQADLKTHLKRNFIYKQRKSSKLQYSKIPYWRQEGYPLHAWLFPRHRKHFVQFFERTQTGGMKPSWIWELNYSSVLSTSVTLYLLYSIHLTRHQRTKRHHGRESNSQSAWAEESYRGKSVFSILMYTEA